MSVTHKRLRGSTQAAAPADESEIMPQDYPIRRAPLPEELRKQMARWALNEMTSDTKAARKIGIPTTVFINARMGKTLQKRTLWKIMQFLKTLPAERVEA